MSSTSDVQQLAQLQELMDRSFDQSSEHLKSIMTAERRISAERLVPLLPCPAVLNVATVTAGGQPRISAVDGHFLRGHWYWTTAANSPKAVQLTARPAISASFTPRDGFGVFCHGAAIFLPPGPERTMLSEHFGEVYGSSPQEWGGEGIAWIRIDPHWLVAFMMPETDEAA